MYKIAEAYLTVISKCDLLHTFLEKRTKTEKNVSHPKY